MNTEQQQLARSSLRRKYMTATNAMSTVQPIIVLWNMRKGHILLKVSLDRRTFMCKITTTYYYWNCKTATNAINTFPPKDHSLNHKIKKQSHEIYKCTTSCTPSRSQMTDAGSRKSVLIRSQLEINSFIHCCYLTLCTLLFTFFCKGCKIKLLFIHWISP